MLQKRHRRFMPLLLAFCLLLFSAALPAGANAESTTTGRFKVAALNVDGMPQTVKIAGLFDLTLNKSGPGPGGSARIGQYIESSGIDLLALSENLNYCSEIRASAPSYSFATQRKGIPTSIQLWDLRNSLFPFDTDGLNLMYRNNLTVSNETILPWDTHYSPYTRYLHLLVPDQNGADGMISKGFRFYQVEFAPGVVVDVYILHMDAEISPEDTAARSSQLQQLAEAINSRTSSNPVIVMGDTNCRYTRDSLKTDLIDAVGLTDAWVELVRQEKGYPNLGEEALMVYHIDYQQGEVVDKILYKNVEGSPLQIQAVSYSVDAEGYTVDGELLGDHAPVIVEFSYSLAM